MVEAGHGRVHQGKPSRTTLHPHHVNVRRSELVIGVYGPILGQITSSRAWMWAYVKNYVSFECYPFRTQKDVRENVLDGMYGGPKRDGVVHVSVDSTLTQKFSLHTHIYINEYVEKLSPTLRGRGTVGNL